MDYIKKRVTQSPQSTESSYKCGMASSVYSNNLNFTATSFISKALYL